MSTGSSDLPEIRLRRHPRARRLRLRYDAVEDRLDLTLPPRANERRALRWASQQGEWITRQREGRLPAIPLTPGETIPFRGGELRLEHDESAPRRVIVEHGRLVCGGPREHFPTRVERWLRAEARRLLTEETKRMAHAAGVAIEKVSVGDARTRWGSCTSGGRLRFSWRLICAPDEVRRYVVAHEVAHRRHMDHGRAFHALEAELFGGPTRGVSARLGKLGPGLQRIGR